MRIAAGLVVLAACKSQPAGPDQQALNTEAQVQLNRLAKNGKAYWTANHAFPTGTSGPLPVVPCCRQERGLCPTTWMRRTEKPWADLGFEVLDAGHFQLAYESDGTTATARAIADLDCDGTPITYTLTLSVRDGAAHASLDQPSIGAD